MAEKIQPFPREQVMTIMMIRSKIALVSNMEKSPVRPSSMAPTMAMAPMHTVNEAVTKPSTNRASLLLPVFCFSHSPNRSNQCSMLISSPTNAPSARLPTNSMARPLTTLPFSTVRIPSSTPPMAMNSTETPQAFCKESWCRSFKNLPNRPPRIPPRMMATVLISVPKPNMAKTSFFLRIQSL